MEDNKANSPAAAPAPAPAPASSSPVRERSRSPPAERRIAFPSPPKAAEQDEAALVPAPSSEGEGAVVVSAPPQSETAAVHKCGQCNATFRSLKALWGHTHIHTRDRDLNLNIPVPQDFSAAVASAAAIFSTLSPAVAASDEASVSAPSHEEQAEAGPSEKKWLLPDLNEMAPEDSE